MAIKKLNGGEKTKKTFTRESIYRLLPVVCFTSTWANIASGPNPRPHNQKGTYKMWKKSKFRTSQIRKVSRYSTIYRIRKLTYTKCSTRKFTTQKGSVNTGFLVWKFPEAEFLNEAEFMKYNFVEGSRHNLESSQYWGFIIDLFNQREGVWFSIRFSSTFLVYSNWTVRTVRGCVSLKKGLEISRQSSLGDCEQQGGKFLRLCLNFVQEISLCTKKQSGTHHAVTLTCPRRGSGERDLQLPIHTTGRRQVHTWMN
jgi:hypothetical protein